MKNLFLLIVISFLSLQVYAQQNIGIGTTTPHSKAILDLTSTTKGFLMPRMTYDDRVAISSPPNGLMVYQTNSIIIPTSPSGIYFYHSNSWKRIARADENNGASGWTISNDDQYHNLAGNVGIGLTNPTSKLHVVGTMRLDGNSFLMNHASGILQFQNAGESKAYIQLSGNNLRIGTNFSNGPGSLIMRMNGTDRIVVDSLGSMGIGSLSPHVSARLDVGGTTKGVLLPRLNTSQLFAIDSPAEGLMVYNTDQHQYYHHDGNAWRGILNSTYWLRPLNNRLRITNSVDSVGIGVTGPDARLHVANGSFANYTTHNGHIMVGFAGSENLAIGNYEILARNDGQPAPLYLQQDGGVVRLGDGSVAANTKLQITDGDEVGLTTHGHLIIGETAVQNMVMDPNEIQARNNGAANTLNLQPDGGMVRMGIGTVATGTKLHVTDGTIASLTQHGHVVVGETNNANLVMDYDEIQARSNGIASTLYLQRSGGAVDIGGPLHIEAAGSSGEIVRLDGDDPNIGFYQNGSYKSFISQYGNNLWIQSTAGRMRIEAPQVAIGPINTSPNMDQYKLTVDGKVICEELKVALYGNWPDYVFAKGYSLKPLHELKSFIETNKHLPNIPKASEVESSGIEVGEMNRKLLEKVEELTLYVIQLQEQIDALKKNKSE